MQLSWDTMTFVNLVLSIVILVFGILGYQRSKSQVVLYVGIAFGLFALSHLATLLGLKDSLKRHPDHCSDCGLPPGGLRLVPGCIPGQEVVLVDRPF